MASKSKRRRRVLGASCILAALIIAGSSFAWFTSKDEVTNRLSANADYGVSIVESFAPPANWLPGNIVNKDVYATNTGTIGAFVEEDVTGVLSITVEKKLAGSAAPDTTNIDSYVKLTQEERYVVEAGAYLALKPAGDTINTVGDQVIIRPGDNGGAPAATDFTPNANGLYVFRRIINVAETQAETFDYVGYYYKDGTYYKVHIDSVTPDNVPDLANDLVYTDGNLDGASYGFYQEVTETVTPTLAYDATNNQLVATYNTGNNTSGDAALTAAATAYDKALEDYQLALAERDKATTEGSAASGDLSAKAQALNTARTNLKAAQDALRTAETNKATAQAEYNAALAEKNSLETAVTTSKNSLWGNGNNNNITNPADGSLLKTYNTSKSDYEAVQNTEAAAQLATDVGTWLGSDPTAVGVDATHTNLNSLTYDELMLFDATGLSSLKYDVYTKFVAYKLAERDLNAELNKLYGKTITDIDVNAFDETDAGNYTAGSLWGRYQTASTTLNAKTTALGADTDAASDADDASAWAKYKYAVAQLGADTDAASDADDASAWAKYKFALAAYNTAAGADTAASGKVAAAYARVASAKATLDAAQAAYNDALQGVATAGTSDIKINIKLSDDVVTTGGTTGKWQILPTTVVDNTAKFYYTSILPGGVTSSKLIDSVELDSSVTQDMYKSFDFDLNVALKSAQITYADDNKTILATAATDEIGKTPTLSNPTDANTALTWPTT